MKKILAMATVLVAMAVVGSATTCGGAGGTGNVATIGSCSLDGLTFTFGPGSVLPSNSEIDLMSVLVVGNDVQLNFDPFLGLTPGAPTDLHFTFTVPTTPLPDLLT